MKPKLEAHIRSRGCGTWVSATTSDKGSYNIHDVLAYLSRHLPELPPRSQTRNLRIMLADDAGSHLSPLVSKPCWSRGYVYIPQGGGTTPFTQPCDTDLNQHAKRKYSANEGAALLRLLQLGQRVPQLRHVDCIDLMVDVCSETALHLRAAEGFVKTGPGVCLLTRTRTRRSSEKQATLGAN